MDKVIRYALFSDVLKAAIHRGVLEVNDFWINDKHCMDKLLQSGQADLVDRLTRLEGELKYTVTDNPTGKKNEFRLAKKLRWIDPMIYFRGEKIEGKSSMPLSEFWPDYAHSLALQKSKFKPVQYACVKGWSKLSE